MSHAVKDVIFYRHGPRHGVTTPLDRFVEVRHWLSYLTAKDFVIQNLHKVHGLSLSDAKSRAKQIIPHARDSAAFLAMIDHAPVETAFVPGYYSILNLIKVAILASPLHASLQTQRYHGARYEIDAKDSQSLATDFITLMSGGAMAIYYNLLTGKSWGNNKRIGIGELYSYITDVSHEYQLATGEQSNQGTLRLGSIAVPKSTDIRACLTVVPRDSKRKLRVRDIPSLRGVKAVPNSFGHFHSIATFPKDTKSDAILDQLYDRRYIYYHDGTFTRVPLKSLPIEPIEEIPIALTFFHMSSVARYKPEFLYKVRESRYWPMVSAHLRNGLYRFLILFWSHMQKQTYVVGTE